MGITNYREICLPYCVREVAPGEWIILNREYRSLGDNDIHGPYILMDAHFKITKTQLAKIEHSRNGHPFGGGGLTIYLYDDSTQPEKSAANWKQYMQRLVVLAKCKAIPAGVVAMRVQEALTGKDEDWP